MVSAFGLFALVDSATRHGVFHLFAMFFTLSGAAAAFFHWRARRNGPAMEMCEGQMGNVGVHRRPMKVLATNLVVYDWGFFRGIPASGQIDSDHDIVLADTIFQEIANSDNPPTFARKLFHLLRSRGNADRVFIGQYWDHLSRLETEPFLQVDLCDIINHELTEEFRGVLQDRSFDVSKRILDVVGEPEIAEYETRRADFLHLCEEWTHWVTETQADHLLQFRSNAYSQRQWIRRPDQITEFVISRNQGRFDGPDWREALSQFPDVHAIGRWARILLWYVLRRSIKPNEPAHSFENNWDDAHYAFLTSYTKRIATRDRELRRLVTDLFEEVEIYDD